MKKEYKPKGMKKEYKSEGLSIVWNLFWKSKAMLFHSKYFDIASINQTKNDTQIGPL